MIKKGNNEGSKLFFQTSKEIIILLAISFEYKKTKNDNKIKNKNFNKFFIYSPLKHIKEEKKYDKKYIKKNRSNNFK